MFYDLNVKAPGLLASNSIFEETISEICKLGYRGIAVTTDVDDSIFGATKKLKKKEKDKNKAEQPEDPIPAPMYLNQMKKKYPKVQFYNRLNVSLAEFDNIRKVQHSRNMKKYDVLSVQPLTQNVLKGLSNLGELDIISYDPESRFSLSLNRKTYNQFLNSNVYFEILYSPALTDSDARKNLFSLSHTYHALGRSKNVIVSSGAKTSALVRAPYDIVNFNLLFGLNEEQAKNSLSRTCEKLLIKARRKHVGKSVMDIKKLGNNKKMKIREKEKDKDKDNPIPMEE